MAMPPGVASQRALYGAWTQSPPHADRGGESVSRAAPHQGFIKVKFPLSSRRPADGPDPAERTALARDHQRRASGLIAPLCEFLRGAGAVKVPAMAASHLCPLHAVANELQ